MRKEKCYKKFRHYCPSRNPPSIKKDILPFDSCEIFPYRLEDWCQGRSKWVDRLERFNLSGLCREDPFEINNYHLGFSLNKKKRWTIPKEIGERIEEVQDPRLGVRVSSITRELNRKNWRMDRFVDAMEFIGCTEYHTVSRDGEVAHRSSKKLKSRVRSFTHPVFNFGDPYLPRKVKGAPRRPRCMESDALDGFDLPFDEKRECQFLHISYTITLYSDSASMHNKASYSCDHYKGGQYKSDKKHLKLEDEGDYESEDISNQEDDVIDEVEIIDDALPSTSVDLAYLVVRRERRAKKKSRLHPSPASDAKVEEEGYVVVDSY